MSQGERVIPIFYINLASATRRRKAIEAQLSRMGLAAARIEAKTPADALPEEIERYCNVERYHWVHPVELACSLSHLSAWRALIAYGGPYGMILEDDAVLSPRLPDFLARASEAMALCDLIRLETSLHRLRMEPRPEATVAGIGVYRPHTSAGGSAAYLISTKLARRLIDRTELYCRPIDSVLFDTRHAAGACPSYLHVIPGLAVQAEKVETGVAGEPSSIKPGLAERRDSRPTSTLRHLSFALRDWTRTNIVEGSAKVWLDATGRGKRYIGFEQ